MSSSSSQGAALDRSVAGRAGFTGAAVDGEGFLISPLLSGGDTVVAEGSPLLLYAPLQNPADSAVEPSYLWGGEGIRFSERVKASGEEGL